MCESFVRRITSVDGLAVDGETPSEAIRAKWIDPSNGERDLHIKYAPLVSPLSRDVYTDCPALANSTRVPSTSQMSLIYEVGMYKFIQKLVLGGICSSVVFPVFSEICDAFFLIKAISKSGDVIASVQSPFGLDLEITLASLTPRERELCGGDQIMTVALCFLKRNVFGLIHNVAFRKTGYVTRALSGAAAVDFALFVHRKSETCSVAKFYDTYNIQSLSLFDITRLRFSIVALPHMPLSAVTLSRFINVVFGRQGERVTSPEWLIDICECFVQLFYTLAVFSCAKIVHRDLHFGNVFVCTENPPVNVRLVYKLRSSETATIAMSGVKRIVQIFDYDKSFAASVGPNPVTRGESLDERQDTQRVIGELGKELVFRNGRGEFSSILSHVAELRPIEIALLFAETRADIAAGNPSVLFGNIYPEIAHIAVSNRNTLFNEEIVETVDFKIDNVCDEAMFSPLNGLLVNPRPTHQRSLGYFPRNVSDSVFRAKSRAYDRTPAVRTRTKEVVEID